MNKINYENKTLVTRENYIVERLDQQYGYYDNKAIENQKIHIYCSMISMILTASIPLLTLFMGKFEFLFKVFIVAAGSISTVLGGIICFLKSFDKWIKYRSTAESLLKNKIQYSTLTGEYASCSDKEHALTLLINNCEHLISHEKQEWINMQMTSENKNS